MLATAATGVLTAGAFGASGKFTSGRTRVGVDGTGGGKDVDAGAGVAVGCGTNVAVVSRRATAGGGMVNDGASLATAGVSDVAGTIFDASAGEESGDTGGGSGTGAGGVIGAMGGNGAS